MFLRILLGRQNRRDEQRPLECILQVVPGSFRNPGGSSPKNQRENLLVESDNLFFCPLPSSSTSRVW